MTAGFLQTTDKAYLKHEIGFVSSLVCEKSHTFS